MRVVLFIASLACIVLMALHAWRENLGGEWRVHQQAYTRALSAHATTDPERSLARSFEVKLRQIVLPDGDVTDRCVTCHLGIDDPRMTDEPEPIRTHPGDYLEKHEVNRFGCTMCHDGQGRAVTFLDAAAYERTRFWEKPLLRAPFVEANCYRCHSEVLPQTATYAAGKKIFDSYGCVGCHKVRGQGGYVGPDLSEVGDSSRHLKVPTPKHHDLIERFHGNETVAYLYEAVRWPAAQPVETKMPNFEFTDEQSVALVVYLKSLVRRPTTTSLVPPPKPPQPPADPVERGRLLYTKYCIGCHGDGGGGGVPNPNSRTPVIPALNLLASTFAFGSADEVGRFVAIVRNNKVDSLVAASAQAPAPWPMAVRGRAATREAIFQGLPVTRAAPEGREPLGMPSWMHLLDSAQTDDILCYLLSEMPWDSPAGTQ